MFLGNTDSRIADRNLYLVVFLPCPDADFAAIGYSLGGIHKYVHENLIQLVGKTFDFRNIAKLLHDSNSTPHLMTKKCQSALNAFMNINLLSLGFIEPGKVLESTYHVDDAVG